MVKAAVVISMPYLNFSYNNNQPEWNTPRESSECACFNDTNVAYVANKVESSKRYYILLADTLGTISLLMIL